MDKYKILVCAFVPVLAALCPLLERAALNSPPHNPIFIFCFFLAAQQKLYDANALAHTYIEIFKLCVSLPILLLRRLWSVFVPRGFGLSLRVFQELAYILSLAAASVCAEYFIFCGQILFGRFLVSAGGWDCTCLPASILRSAPPHSSES